MAKDGSTSNVGKVIEIKGVVIDAVFPERLPGIYTALRLDIAAREREEARVLVAEVQQHLGDDRVRAVAMDSTDGLSRGTDVVDTGVPFSAPPSTTSRRRPRAPSAGRSIAIRRASKRCPRRRRSSRPASR